MRSIRTDLAMERRQMAGEIEGIETETRQNGEMEISTVRIQTQRAAKALGRPCGRYVTISCMQRLQPEPALREQLCTVLAEALGEMLPEKGDVLVVGLGNRRVTADALGPRVVDGTLVTRHICAQMPETLSGPAPSWPSTRWPRAIPPASVRPFSSPIRGSRRAPAWAITARA